jgi:hypothetical protein
MPVYRPKNKPVAKKYIFSLFLFETAKQAIIIHIEGFAAV